MDNIYSYKPNHDFRFRKTKNEFFTLFYSWEDGVEMDFDETILAPNKHCYFDNDSGLGEFSTDNREQINKAIDYLVDNFDVRFDEVREIIDGDEETKTLYQDLVIWISKK